MPFFLSLARRISGEETQLPSAWLITGILVALLLGASTALVRTMLRLPRGVLASRRMREGASDGGSGYSSSVYSSSSRHSIPSSRC